MITTETSVFNLSVLTTDMFVLIIDERFIALANKYKVIYMLKNKQLLQLTMYPSCKFYSRITLKFITLILRIP